MGTGRITKRSVEAIPLPSGARREYLWDDTLKGFGVMVTPAGSRSYLIQYRIGGRGNPTSRYTIGRHGSPWTAEQARARAETLLVKVREGVDPLKAERAALAAAAEQRDADERLGFSTYADFFVRQHVDKRKLRSADDIKGVFRRDLKPHFKDKPLTSIRKGDVQACLDLVGARSASAANKAHKWLNKLFVFAVARDDLATSPMEGLARPHEEGKRQRTLSDPETVIVWRAAEAIGGPWGPFVHTLQLTGLRLREAGCADWKEVDLEAAEWVIPGARTKNKRDHLVTLSPLAVSILRELQPDKRLRKGPMFTTGGGKPIAGFSKLKRSLDAKVQEEVAKRAAEAGELPVPLEPWVFHDLRRTLATGCQALGFPIEVGEALLNHVSGTRGGLASIYQLHHYKDEKRAALAAWARHVEALLEGRDESNIVRLRVS